MNASRPKLKLFFDEGVPDSVSRKFADAGHEIILLRTAMPTGSPDPLVCAVAEANDAILVAMDGDMRALASRRGVGKQRFRRLSLIKLSCSGPRAPERVERAMSLIEHEWTFNESSTDRRIFIDISTDVIRTFR